MILKQPPVNENNVSSHIWMRWFLDLWNMLIPDLKLPSIGAVYLGETNVDGSWRIIRSGNNLSFQRRESGAWVQKGSFVP